MPESKEMVIKVDIHDDNEKRIALKAVSTLPGIDSLAMDMKEKKLTIIGDVDPADVVGKLKNWIADILSVEPSKEEKKHEQAEDPIGHVISNPNTTQKYGVHSRDDH